MYLRERQKLFKIWLALFLLGFAAGILLMNLGSGYLKEDTVFFHTSVIGRICRMELDNGNFMKYEMPRRLKLFFLLLLFSTTCFGILFSYLFIVWQGILTGVLITAAVMQYGLKGILFIFAGSFPHQFLFIPAVVMMLYWCCQTCVQARGIFPAAAQKKQYLHQAGILLWIFCIVIIGCILECYVNPIILADMIKLFL